MEVAARCVDSVSVSAVAALFGRGLAERAALDETHHVAVVVSGTVLEAFARNGSLAEFQAWLSDAGLRHVEIPDGAESLSVGRKLELNAELPGVAGVAPPEVSRSKRCGPASSRRRGRAAAARAQGHALH